MSEHPLWNNGGARDSVPRLPSGYGIDHPIALLSQHVDWFFATVLITITVSLASFIRRIYYVETSTACPHLAALEWPQNVAPVDDHIYIMRGGDTFIGQLWAQEGRRVVFGRHRALMHVLGIIPQRNIDCLFTLHNWRHEWNAPRLISLPQGRISIMMPHRLAHFWPYFDLLSGFLQALPE